MSDKLRQHGPSASGSFVPWIAEQFLITTAFTLIYNLTVPQVRLNKLKLTAHAQEADGWKTFSYLWKGLFIMNIGGKVDEMSSSEQTMRIKRHNVGEGNMQTYIQINK